MTVKETLHQEVNALETDLRGLSDYIFANPELGHQEFKSSKAHIALLEKHGFTVETPYAGFDTAFRATFDSGQPGPTIAYLSEYDALPSIGHGCGHNMLGTVDTGAGIALSKVINQTGGRVIVLGTPAEETTGTKVDMANSGVFDDVDVAMCTHPSDENTMSGTSMAIHPIAFEFFGKPAHAAEAPEEGINALDAMLNLFNNINSLRQEMRSSARVHGIITHGGDAANVIPEYTRAEFYVRALDTPYMEVLSEKIINCAKAAALASGCTMKHTDFENIYRDMITNETLSAVYNENASELGIEMVPEKLGENGSIDMGDVSHVVPSIHSYYSITNGKRVIGHTPEFRDCTQTPFAYDMMMKVVETLARTGIDVISKPELLAEIRTEFANRKV
ncbi:amidohydrolase [Aerococcus sp. 150760007-1]|uniref:Peptidase M20 domain-containing protein 2 n=1 Tax=Aerococcus urinaeequi TaxID=51665 RepID=A0ABR5ZVN0_9LACT|nr:MULTISPECIES: M20 family metallopeptidase [Lactobacillales]KAF3300517.1 amidohydrolase [Carnobacterium sp. PL12RED10]MBA5745769.1 M20 family metallopeptidase [Aerococcus urinaeequi]MBA5828457.1 M20 family metallopeptidase [Aerococcus urinaeequi]MBA5859458.1 M20 family metallopeptidase [Aerococcus urinaeequi]